MQGLKCFQLKFHIHFFGDSKDLQLAAMTILYSNIVLCYYIVSGVG